LPLASNGFNNLTILRVWWPKRAINLQGA